MLAAALGLQSPGAVARIRSIPGMAVRPPIWYMLAIALLNPFAPSEPDEICPTSLRSIKSLGLPHHLKYVAGPSAGVQFTSLE